MNTRDLHVLRRDIEYDLEAFPGRTADLLAMKRWERYPLMFYRTDLHVHGRRIACSLIAAMPSVAGVFPQFDIEYAILLALVHDDAELVMGDFQSSNRVLMTNEELSALESKESRAIEVVAARYPEDIRGHHYRALLTDILDVRTPEAQVIKYFDKFEGYAEAMHEVYAGNVTFFERPPTEYGTPPNPFEYYGGLFPKLKDTYKALASLLKSGAPFFDPDFSNDWEQVGREGALHTAESLAIPKGYQPYDSWIGAQLASGDPEIIESLTVAKEHASR